MTIEIHSEMFWRYSQNNTVVAKSLGPPLIVLIKQQVSYLLNNKLIDSVYL